eukprot:scaffold55764_cov20-Tisochrysis_lutea.AAC.2
MKGSACRKLGALKWIGPSGHITESSRFLCYNSLHRWWPSGHSQHKRGPPMKTVGHLKQPKPCAHIMEFARKELRGKAVGDPSTQPSNYAPDRHRDAELGQLVER